jgi:hypothetical protein
MRPRRDFRLIGKQPRREVPPIILDGHPRHTPGLGGQGVHGAFSFAGIFWRAASQPLATRSEVCSFRDVLGMCKSLVLALSHRNSPRDDGEVCRPQLLKVHERLRERGQVRTVRAASGFSCARSFSRKDLIGACGPTIATLPRLAASRFMNPRCDAVRPFLTRPHGPLFGPAVAAGDDRFGRRLGAPS